MIRKTVYFRDQEDFDRFNAIGNKAAWLHEHLDMPKATKDGYRSEHSYAIPNNWIGANKVDIYKDDLIANLDEPTSEPFEGAA